MFLNLVNNAIKFTSEGGVTLILSAKLVSRSDKESDIRGDYEIYCAVQDTGIGISEEAQADLFDPFSQADSSISRKYGGTGLGLTISKKLIEAMGSTIRIESAPHQGSRFYFTLLMERGSAVSVNESHATDIDKPALPTKRILVVEDNDMNRKVLSGFLERLGQITTVAQSGGDAIDQCKKSSFDIILMDIQLPDMSGVEATQILRKLTEYNTAKTPIIALTGNVMLDDVKSYYKASMNGFLAKPIDHDMLYEIILNVHHGKLDNPFPEENYIVSSEGLETSSEQCLMDMQIDIDEFTLETDTQNYTDLLNYDILKSLLTNLGKKQCEELIAGFLEKTDELIETLEVCYEKSDSDLIKARAHELKGMAGNFGMNALSVLACEIEAFINKNDLEQVHILIQKLSACNHESKLELLEWLEKEDS